MNPELEAMSVLTTKMVLTNAIVMPKVGKLKLEIVGVLHQSTSVHMQILVLEISTQPTNVTILETVLISALVRQVGLPPPRTTIVYLREIFAKKKRYKKQIKQTSLSIDVAVPIIVRLLTRETFVLIKTMVLGNAIAKVLHGELTQKVQVVCHQLICAV